MNEPVRRGPPPDRADGVRRLRAAAGRLRTSAGADPTRLTGADPATGERWDRGQVLSHCAEMIPYWLGEIEALVAVGGDAPFGRVKTDPERIDRIAAGRDDDPDRLLDDVDAGVDSVDRLLGRLSPTELELVGHHSTLGPMNVSEIVTEFLVDHLEQHADQLESLQA